MKEFNQSARIGSDMTDVSQRTLQNTKYLDRNLDSIFYPDSHSHIDFATNYTGMMASGMNGGVGLGPQTVEHETDIFWKTSSQRPLEKLQLMQRPFITVPYLGKGSCDTVLESQLMQGDLVRNKKSVSTIMENNFMPLDNYPLDNEKLNRMKSSQYTVEEIALGGWVRGGQTSRVTEQKYVNTQSKTNTQIE